MDEERWPLFGLANVTPVEQMALMGVETGWWTVLWVMRNRWDELATGASCQVMATTNER